MFVRHIAKDTCSYCQTSGTVVALAYEADGVAVAALLCNVCDILLHFDPSFFDQLTDQLTRRGKERMKPDV